MAVTKYDGHYSFMQDTLARFGDEKAEAWGKLNDNADRSYLLERKKEVDDAALKKLSSRDKERAKTDPNFKPKDDDFTQPPTFKYNAAVNYYKTLGIEDNATQDEVKKAYRKLSLVYHPDKTRDLPQEEKDEYAEVFIELKNAYKLLADNPTRRQYDYERDRNLARTEVRGKPAPKDEAAFEAAVALAKLAEKYNKEPRKPSQVVTVKLQCKLEKFVHGGHKAVERDRRVKEKFTNPPEFKTEGRLYRIHVPPGAEPPFAVEFPKLGDHHADREPDTVKFLLSPKPNERVQPQGLDLQLTERLDLGEGWHAKPYLSAEVPVLRGRHLLLWGRNPFFRTVGAEQGELRVAVKGEGINHEGSTRFKARLGMRGAPDHISSWSRRGATGPSTAGAGHREFLERFGLGPAWGPTDGTSKPPDAMQAEPMQRRLRRRMAQAVYTCDVELVPVAEHVVLCTSPGCGLGFFSNPKPSSEGRLQPYSVFAISLVSPPCGRKKASQEWERLRTKVAPLVLLTGFKMWCMARDELPRAIARTPAFPGWAQLRIGEERDLGRRVPWKQMGDRALLRGDLWQAIFFYSRRLEELEAQSAEGEEAAAEEGAAGKEGGEASPDEAQVAKVLSNRACCFARLGDYAASLEDARNACLLSPQWATGWRRVGLAAWQLGGELRKEAVGAYRRAVELQPYADEIARLQTAVLQLGEQSVEAAHESKEMGNEALRTQDFGAAVAHFTVGVAQLPPPADPREDDNGLFRAVLLTNRAIALARLGQWEAAVADGKAAVASKFEFAKAHIQLGVSLLGCGLHEQAYAEFARAVALESESENPRAHKGRKQCLVELQLWHSVAAKARSARRFGIDWGRPYGSTRVFAISDVFFGKKCNENWAHAIDGFAFQDDVLIVAGGVSEALGGIVKGLTALKSKFRRIFFMAGGLELSIHRSEANKFADSLAKLFAILEACDGLDVDVFPAPVCAGVYLLPLFSWYNAAYDEKDPFPNPNLKYDAGCRWPIDADEQLWKFMLKLNEHHLRAFVPQEPSKKRMLEGEMITFSHFLPRRGLPLSNAWGINKVVGCEDLDETIRATGSKLHVYGRSGQRNAQVLTGVRYVHAPIGEATKDRGPDDPMPPMMLVHNGRGVCMQEWGIDGTMQTRVMRITLYVMPRLDEDFHKRSDLFTLARKFNTMPGIVCSFQPLGTAKLDKEDFSTVMPELMELSHNATHAFIVVADNLPTLRGFLHCEDHRKNWQAVSGPFVDHYVEVISPLSLELAPAERLPNNMEKDDPTLVFYFLNLGKLNEGSEGYGKMVNAVSAINNLQGAAGRIAAGLQAKGFNNLTTEHLLWELGWPEDKSLGCTHVFTVAVDCPGSFKLLRNSKTFARFKGAYEPHLHYGGMPPQLAGVMPLKVTANLIGPRPTYNAPTKGGR